MLKFLTRFAAERDLSSFEKLETVGIDRAKRQKNDISRRVTRGATFGDAWASSFCQDKYGAATTHWRKLEDRVHRGVGNPCPLLLIGLPSSIVTVGENLSVEAIAEGDENAIAS
jgi:hypothetical protein